MLAFDESLDELMIRLHVFYNSLHGRRLLKSQ